MPDLWMDVDVALSEVPVNIMPLVDSTDFITIEAAVAYNAAGMSLVWNFCTTAGAFTSIAVTPTTGGVYDWAEHTADKGMYTIELPASGGASANNDTEGVGWFTGSATGVLPWRGPMIGFRAAALNNALIDGGDVLDVSVTEIGGATQSATDLKDFADAGYDPATHKVQGVVLTDTTTTNTDMRGTDSAAVASVCTETRLAELDAANLPADVDAILTDTGTTLPGELSTIAGYVDTELIAIIADTEDIQARLPAALTAGGNIKADTLAISGDTAAADNVEDVFDGTYAAANMKVFWENGGGATTKTVGDVGSTAIRSGTAQAGAAGTITLDASASATDNLYNGTICLIRGGTGAGQCRAIVDYVGSTKVATITPNWTTNPDATSTFELQPASSILRHLLSMAVGKFTKSGNVYTFLDWDNATTLSTLTWSATGRTRS